jgi:hypothetical protein
MAMGGEAKADIVERLRIGRETCGVDMCRTREARSGCTCAEAADEIERLREALREISTRNFPEGTATLELRKIARAALGDKA